jgi:SAM-dependent methyltransferase
MSALPPGAFERLDPSPDDRFYLVPRFVTHLDENALAAVTDLYRERLPSGGTLLDLMSSWISHLPPEVAYHRVVGLGLNRDELVANPRLDRIAVQDLNRIPALPFEDGEFDGAMVCASVQYLTRPVAVFRELARVLRTGAPLIVTFSNRCFPTKAVAIWRALDDRGHVELVQRYFADAGGWERVEALDRSPGRGDPLYAVIGYRAEPMSPAP